MSSAPSLGGGSRDVEPDDVPPSDVGSSGVDPDDGDAAAELDAEGGDDLDVEAAAERGDAPGVRADPPPVEITAPSDAKGRLDKVLAEAADPALGLSRSRLRALIEDGRLSLSGATLRDPAAKVKPGAAYRLAPPAPRPARPQPEAIALDVLFEDADLLVLDKPPGMAAHPAPGSESGTLVNALLAHCGDTLSGVGGEARPGIVHRLDKDTSGLLVVAKTDAAHLGLSRQFAARSIERRYDALALGAPERGDPRLAGSPATLWEAGGWLKIDAPIGRRPSDRKRMGVARSGGRPAVTRVRVAQRFGARACRLVCRLETGRTHQIRVHLAHIGHPLIGDPLYGRGRAALAELEAEAVTEFSRQALHAGVLGFTHPTRGEAMRFERAPPEDFTALAWALSRAFGSGVAPDRP